MRTQIYRCGATEQPLGPCCQLRTVIHIGGVDCYTPTCEPFTHRNTGASKPKDSDLLLAPLFRNQRILSVATAISAQKIPSM